MNNRYPFSQQWDAMDCGPACLEMVASYHGRITDRAYIRQKSYLNPSGASFAGLQEAAEKIGFESLAVEIDMNTLKTVPLPCILHWENKHFVVLYSLKKSFAIIGDPAQGIFKMEFSEMIQKWLPTRNADKGFALLLEALPLEGKAYDEPKHRKSHGLFRLWLYFKRYKKEGIQLVLGLVFGSMAQLALPFLTQGLVDYGIQLNDIHFVYIILFAQVVFFVSLASVEIIRTWILLHLTQQVNLRLVSDFLKRLLQLPISFFDSKHSGDIIQRIQDNRKVQDLVSSQSLSTVFSIVTLIAFGMVLWYYHTLLALVFVMTLLAYSFWSLAFLKKQMRWDYIRFQRESDTQRTIWQLVRGLPAIKMNQSERKRRSEWMGIQQQLFQIQYKQLSLEQKQRYGALFIHQIGALFLLFLSARFVIEGQLTLGAMLAIQFIVGQVGIPLASIAQFVVEAQAALLSLERMQEVYHHPAEETEGSTVEMNSSDLVLENISFRYGPKSTPLALDSVSVTVQKGKTTALVGASGSGKSTLLKLLLGYYDAYDGHIQVEQTNFKKVSKSIWRERCGAVMQEGFLFEDTLVSNITESEKGAVDTERLDTAIRIAQLFDFIQLLPLGLQTRLGPDGMNLSGGERQRVLLARALYKAPQFFFLDEATSAMDTELEHRVMQGLKKFYAGRTVLIIAHRMSTVRDADHIVVLDKGKVVEQGIHNDLVLAKGAYYNLVKYQLELGT